MNPFVTANGKPVAAQLPCSREEFLVAQILPSFLTTKTPRHKVFGF
jgi:hypothetical protein